MPFGRAACALLSAAALLALPSCTRHQDGQPLNVKLSFGEVGTSPGQFSYPRCLDVDRSGVWVIDKLARVQRLDAVTGEGRGGWQMPEWKEGKPTGMTVWDAEGSDGPIVFVADTHYFRVMVYDGGSLAPGREGEGLGALLTRFGEYGNGPGQFVFPTDIAVLPTPDGKAIARLYVSEYQHNERISVFEPKSPVTRQQLIDAAKGGDLGPAPSPFEFKFSFGSQGDSASADTIQFNRPQSIAIDTARQELVVNDACNHRVGRFTLDGKLIAWINPDCTTGPAIGQFAYPYGLALLGDGTALVCEFGNHRIQRIDLASGASMGTWGQLGRQPGQLSTPWGVAVRGDLVYVLDSGNNRVQAFEKPRLKENVTGTSAVKSTIMQGHDRGTDDRSTGGAG
ncbi:MAG TPA: hypothetical protein VD997_12760 [Phycisphaerales bacterium]|nr:hypothetical protein [Phycisphaerales bacterium]